MRTPQETYQAMAQELSAGLRQAFPISAAGKTIELLDLHPDTLPAPDDWNGQKEAVMGNRTWGAPIRATVALKEADGAVLDRKVLRLATVPAPTNRHTFIVDGREYQISHQRRLRPGVYTKLDRNGRPVADFNLGKGRNFSVGLDPEKDTFHLRFGNSHIPLASVLAGLRESGDPSLGLGKAFDRQPAPGEVDRDLRTLFAETHLNQPVPEDPGKLREAVRHWFEATTLTPDVTHMTLGESYAHVTDRALRTAARHVLEIHQDKRQPTDKDQLAYQEIHGVEDFLRERITKNKRLIASRVRQKLDRANKLDDLNLSAAIHPLIHGLFTQSTMASNPMQINPLEMRENAYKLTSMGEGGIGDANAIPVEVRNIHPSTIGFIDPVRTPDNSHAGVDVRTAIGTRKIGKTLQTQVIDRSGKRSWKSPQELYHAYVAHDRELSDNGVMRAVHEGHLDWVKPEQIEYHIPTEDQFTVSTALVPFIPNSHAHRIAMGAKMLGQAVSLIEREPQIVSTTHADRALDGLLPHAPADGTVMRITPGVLHLRGEDGAAHRVNFPHDFPLNGGSYLHTDLAVKVGDKVRKGQLLGDSNFSRNGKLALGKNLTVAYLPYKGLNFEDGVVLTEQGARKLTSQHLHTEEVWKDGRTLHDLTKFKAHFPATYEHKQLNKLDDHGVIQVGQEVVEGDPLIAVLRKRVQDPEQLILGKAHKALMEPYRDATLTWDKPYAGKVTAVSKTGSHIKVTIQSQAPIQIGDKMAARYGNKGVVTAIIPDHEAPHTKDGTIPDIMLNSAGLNTRMNNGQLYEVMAAKALQKLNKSGEKVPQFTGVNTHNFISKLVERAGVEPDEEMFDPKTGQSIGKVLIGPEYFLKLFKQAETGFAARAGGRYDIDMRPAKGGEEGAKSVGTLDFFGLLAHGSKDLLRQAATHNAEYNPEVLQAMWRGQPLPPPKPTFAWRKFETMLRGAGINVRKDGHSMVLLPMTDRDTLALSQGEIKRPLLVTGKEDTRTGLPYRPEPGGLFDHGATGGLVGNKWSHITLHEPVVSPLFKRPARILLGLKQQEFDHILGSEGGAGIAKRLAKIDPTGRMAEIKAQLTRTAAPTRRDDYYKQLKYLKPLAEHGLKPDEAYVVRHVPVIPPSIRPIYPDAETGKIVNSDANVLYQNLMLVNEQLAHHASEGDPETVRELRLGLHDALTKVVGMDGTADAMSKEQQAQGFLKIITGNRAKDGFFQSKLLSRRQDVAGRGVVTPNPALGLDDLGLPEPMAWKLYRNHVVGELTRSGLPLDRVAQEVKEQSSMARSALEAAMRDHPVIMTRAPALHRFNLMAFKPQLVTGKHIEVPNLVVKGFNMDFDGDAVNLHIPLGPEATRDAWRMLPSKNLFATLNRSPLHVPSQEVTMGLWRATHVPQDAKAVRTFASRADAIAAYRKGEIGLGDPIEVA